MFLMGNFQHTLDDKNRIRLPADIRKEMGNDYFLMPGSNGCIFVYKADETQSALSSILSLNSFNPEQSLLISKLAAFSRSVSADSQGRFMLPDDLISIMKIKKDVRIVGSINKAEIWSEERWQAIFGTEDSMTTAAIDDIYRQLDAATKQAK